MSEVYPKPAADTSWVKRQDGGYWTGPNRWIDAGYMAAAPGSVTQVYIFLCRWADNGTHDTAQPMRLIALKCGLTEDVARKAARTLERWGCIVRSPDTGPNGVNVWTLLQLPNVAPPYPDKIEAPTNSGPRSITPPFSQAPYQPKKTNLRIREQPERDDAPDGASSHPGKEGRKGSRSKPLTVVPDPYEPTPEQVEWAINDVVLSRREIEEQTLRFVDWHKQNDKKARDWNAAWRNWMRKVPGFRPGQRTKRATSGGMTPEGGKMW